jgi:hypothetical protein
MIRDGYILILNHGLNAGKQIRGRRCQARAFGENVCEKAHIKWATSKIINYLFCYIIFYFIGRVGLFSLAVIYYIFFREIVQPIPVME